MRDRSRVLVGFGAFGLFWGSWGAVLPLVEGHAHVGNGGLGAALLWIGVGALVSLRPVGSLADRHPRWTLPVGLALLGISAVGPVIVTGTLGLSLACLLIGVSSGAADAAINAAGAACEARGDPVLSLGHGVFSALVVAASLTVAALLVHAASAWPLLLAGGVLVAAAGVAAVLPPGRAIGTRPAPRAHRQWFRRPPTALLTLGGLAALAYLIENAWQSWAAIQLHTTLHASTAVAAVGPAAFAACAAAGRFAGHGLQWRVSARTLLGTGAALAAAGSALAACATSIPVAIAGIAVAGLGTSVCAPTLIALAGATAPRRPGAATSTVITVAYLGFVLGPGAVGVLAEATTLRIALAAVAVVAVVLAVTGSALPLSRDVGLTSRPLEVAECGGDD